MDGWVNGRKGKRWTGGWTDGCMNRQVQHISEGRIHSAEKWEVDGGRVPARSQGRRLEEARPGRQSPEPGVTKPACLAPKPQQPCVHAGVTRTIS